MLISLYLKLNQSILTPFRHSGINCTLLFLLLGSKHQLRADMGVEVLLAEGLKLHGTLLQSETLLVGVLSDLGCHVVTDNGVQAGDKHQTGEELV